MIISDLTYLETVDSSAQVKGGLLNFFTTQYNTSVIKQRSEAYAGNGGFFNAGNVAAAVNAATPIQVNA